MFEIAQLLIEQIIKTLDFASIKKNRDARKKAEIGANLFLLYSTLNRVYGRGHGIVDELEAICKRLERYESEGRNDRTVKSWQISGSIIDQYKDLLRIRIAFIKLHRLLDVVSEGASREMYVFIGGKVNAISVLGHLVSGITPNHERYGFAGENSSSALFGAQSEKMLVEEIERLKSKGSSDSRDLASLLKVQLPEEKIGNIGELTPEQVESLRTYLAERNPREALEAIKPTLEKFHKDLQENFSVGDVAFRVGQESWRLDEDPFWNMHRH